MALNRPERNSAATATGTRTPTGPTELTLPSQVLTLAFSPDGARLAVGGKDNTTRLFDVRTGKQDGDPLTGHSKVIRAVAFSRRESARHRK
nr:hypothetical protein [Nocardia sp. SYP-A9097]